jgi:hypothetical protein
LPEGLSQRETGPAQARVGARKGVDKKTPSVHTRRMQTSSYTPPALSISILDQATLDNILKVWEAQGAKQTAIATIRDWSCHSAISCLGVVGEDCQALAIFDIRDAIAHIKNMDVIFSPALDLDLDGQSFEAVDRNLFMLLYILSEIFKYVVELSDKWGTVKIYNDSPQVGMIFVGFAKHLRERAPGYEVKLYSRWVEIKNTNGGGKKHG